MRETKLFDESLGEYTHQNMQTVDNDDGFISEIAYIKIL